MHFFPVDKCTQYTHYYNSALNNIFITWFIHIFMKTFLSKEMRKTLLYRLCWILTNITRLVIHGTRVLPNGRNYLKEAEFSTEFLYRMLTDWMEMNRISILRQNVYTVCVRNFVIQLSLIESHFLYF